MERDFLYGKKASRTCYLMVFLQSFDLIGRDMAFPECELGKVLGMDLLVVNWAFALISMCSLVWLVFFQIFLLLGMLGILDFDKSVHKFVMALLIILFAGLFARLFFFLVMSTLMFYTDLECTREFSNGIKWNIGLWCARATYITAVSIIYYLHRFVRSNWERKFALV